MREIGKERKKSRGPCHFLSPKGKNRGGCARMKGRHEGGRKDWNRCPLDWLLTGGCVLISGGGAAAMETKSSPFALSDNERPCVAGVRQPGEKGDRKGTVLGRRGGKSPSRSLFPLSEGVGDGRERIDRKRHGTRRKGRERRKAKAKDSGNVRHKHAVPSPRRVNRCS